MATSNKDYGAHYKKSIGKTTLGFLVKQEAGEFVHQQENIAQRSRHGLFTQPMTLATGDQYFDKKPDQVPKGVSVNKRLVQKVGPQLFQKMGSTNIGDLYKDKFRQGQLYIKQKADLTQHDHAFIAGGKQRLVKHSEFEHKKQFDDKVFDTRDDQGRVKVGQKNVTTNNMKKGFGTTGNEHLFSNYEYKGSPYDNARDLEMQERLKHKAAIKQPFVPVSNPSPHFIPNYQTYHQGNEPYEPKDHDNQFRSKTVQKWTTNNPNKKGFNGTFSNFKYIEEGEKPRHTLKHQSVWKPNFNGTSKGLGQTLAKPCPVPSQMVLNSIRRGK